ncbi:MAG: hypothetical protein WCX71_00215 [Candidatus Buchananbacteria bacterium]
MKKLLFSLVFSLVLFGFLFCTGEVLAVTQYPDGTLLRDSSNKVYVIKQQKKLHLKTLAELKKYKSQKIIFVDKSVTDAYQNYVESKYADGVLLKSTKGKIYLIKEQKKYLIKNLVELKKYSKAKTYNVSDAIINSFADYSLKPLDDLASLQEVMNKLRAAELSKTPVATSTYQSLFSEKTFELFGFGVKIDNSIADIKYTNPVKNGQNYLVNQTVIYKNGRTVGGDVLFIKEGGAWKFAAIETLNKGIEAYNVEKDELRRLELSDSKVDLVVTDIKVYPNPPKVNDENTEAEVFIKNIGTKAALDGVDFDVTLSDSNQLQTPVTLFDIIKPGQTVSAVVDLYDDFFKKEPDLPGVKKITAEIMRFGTSTDDLIDGSIFSKAFKFVK